MVLIRTAITQGLRIAGRIDRKYNINKIFVEKYVPPGYRRYVRAAFDITGSIPIIIGISNYIQSLNAPDSPGRDNDSFPQIQPRKLPQTYKSNKTRRRPAVCYPTKRGTRPYNRFR